jgi:lambda repressor-like predicted transcriptional regulator
LGRKDKIVGVPSASDRADIIAYLKTIGARWRPLPMGNNNSCEARSTTMARPYQPGESEFRPILPEDID